MNKLTDSEIVKSLEKILNTKFEEDRVPTVVCTVDFIRSVYNFIDGLRSEVCYFEDRIDTINTETNEIIDLKDAEIERYKKVVGELTISEDGESAILLDDHTTEYIKKDLHKIFMTMARKQSRAEAIKEFIEKFKAYIPSIDGDTTMDCVERAINQAKKEMVGDNDAQT